MYNVHELVINRVVIMIVCFFLALHVCYLLKDRMILVPCINYIHVPVVVLIEYSHLKKSRTLFL